jgi:TetR/AcrR family transcriptional regulator, fatty acid metabolism regulator protein
MQDAGPLRSLKERQRLEREELILSIGEEVLFEKGFHDTSMDEIAARVGIAKGTLYLHFARKEDMVYAIFERLLNTFKARIEAASSINGTAQEKLQFLLHSMYMGLHAKGARLLYAFYNSTELHMIVKSRRNEIIPFIGSHISALIEQGKANGEFDPAIPTEVMQCGFITLLSPVAYHLLVAQGLMNAEELAQYMGHIFFRGVVIAANCGENVEQENKEAHH